MTNSKASYVDGFVFKVPKKNREMYEEMAKYGKDLWMKYGAIDYKECLGDDLQTKATNGMKQLSFIELTGAKPDEDVWFSFITFKSKQHRDEVNAKVMNDPSMTDPKMKDMPMPFDPNKMAYGGFSVIVSN